ncbi:MAG TPA: gliding motility-associated ABC transporter ATP-binding subunit GldA [Chitinophagaceae bacterium]|nr:gliding motility-associated ABC transporter ATP-binding subunit GldA [Chitinophagaceae bacterium]HMW65455.1 gliding motility-associated ABC transporter ATP-binding subunit GldA [Chitinophagaceae bacterium]HNA90644.1 gliding motility-associated ABC transporter ATP-binding subunit GldA [Chitinophagaceae bacterium]HNF37540.1 gliding motility-associated ABC transporter ATP-binding subunit GldA [Chitinophagaceae bacterium]HNF47354.1 gliding motility-associated ABC transporter ATP-binding subunit 
MSIEVKNLLKAYGEQKAVNDISFHVNKGEIVGFLGPNGAGKSTTMKMITGYLQPTAGEAKVCGINVAVQPVETKKKIGYLAELNALYYDMYVKEYLAFVAAVHDVQNAKEAIQNVITTVGLTTEAGKKIGQLSKGYKQRVGLAAAIIHQPEVLILDEPTSGLDPNQIIEIREVIRQQGKDKTVLFSSHILQEVEALCDRVIIINKGQIVADDKLANLQVANSSTQTIIVSFKEQVNENLLKQLGGIKSIHTSEMQGATVFKIQCDDADAVKKNILQLAVDQHLNIISLQTEANNLEAIFRSLTGEKNEAAIK